MFQKINKCLKSSYSENKLLDFLLLVFKLSFVMFEFC